MKYKQGMGMVEVIIASAVMSVVLVAIITSYNSMAGMSVRNTDAVQANFLLEEGAEAIRIMRDTSWSQISSLTLGTPYFLYWNTSTWVATTTPIDVDQFDRNIVFSAVQRDANFNIVSSGGSVDPNSRKATITVSWINNVSGTTTRSIETYIFNTFNN